MAADIGDNLMVLYEVSIFSGKITGKLSFYDLNILFVPISNLVGNKGNRKISLDCIKSDKAANKMYDRKLSLNCIDIVFSNCDAVNDRLNGKRLKVMFPTYELTIIEACPNVYGITRESRSTKRTFTSDVFCRVYWNVCDQLIYFVTPNVACSYR